METFPVQKKLSQTNEKSNSKIYIYTYIYVHIYIFPPREFFQIIRFSRTLEPCDFITQYYRLGWEMEIFILPFCN